jgi:hypothetical protein
MTEELFSSENKEHINRMMEILKCINLYPSRVDLCSKCKQEADKKIPMNHLENFCIAFKEHNLANNIDISIPGFSVNKGKKKRGYMITVYGQPKVGKSTFCSYAKKPLFGDVEQGISHIDCQSVQIQTWEQFRKILGWFKEQNKVDTLIIDTADVLEKKLWNSLIKKNNWKSIESPGFGRGYKEALEEWVRSIDEMKEMLLKNKNFIFTAHSQIKTIMSTEGENYDRHNINLHNTVAEYFFGQMDGVFFAYMDNFIMKNSSGDNISKTSGRRFLAVSDFAMAQVGNRFGLTGKLEMNSKVFDLIEERKNA